MKILIINQHTKNFGDDIAALSLINHLLKHEKIHKIHIIYNTKGQIPINNPKVVHDIDLTLKNIGFFNILFYFILKIIGLDYCLNIPLNDFISRIKSCDQIIVSPSGANIGIYRDWRYLIKLLIVCLEDKKPLFYLNTVGPSHNILFDKLSKYVLNASIVYVRERASQDYLSSIGINSYLGVDTAFAGNLENIAKTNKIGFIPTDLDWHPFFKNKKYIDDIYSQIVDPLINFASENKLEIAIIPHLCSEKEKELNENIYSYIKKRYSDVNNITHLSNAFEYEKQIASCRYVIGMRYHSIVLAAKNAVPFISIAYENKMKEVCQYTEMTKYLVKLYDNNLNYDLHAMLIELKNNYINIESSLRYILTNSLYNKALLPLREFLIDYPEQFNSERDNT